MNHFARVCALSLAATTITGSIAVAVPAQNVCVSVAQGVPFRFGPPQWLDWGSGTQVDASLDDPRWLGATGHSFHLGSARAPLLFRALWANGPSITGVGTQDFLYLSFIADLEALTSSGPEQPRDLFLGFRRQSTFAGPGGNENAYIFQFHLKTGSSTPLVTPAHCSDFSTCDVSSGSEQDFWRVFVDRGATGSCPTVVGGEKFDRFVSATNDAPIPWMTGAAHGDAVRYWKLDATQPPLLQNRWAVQLRIPIASNTTSSLAAGIPPDATFWYEGTAALTTTPTKLYAPVGWWPRTTTEPVCPATGIQDSVVHAQLGDPDKWSRITRFAGPRPAGCDSGLTIETANIGSAFNAAPGTDFAALTPPGRVFKPGGINTVVAQVANLTPTEVKAPMVARFRLAEWGSEPWLNPTEHGVWKDMRGAEKGICGTGLAPDCICQSGTPPTCPAPPEFKVPPLIDVVAPFDGKPDPGTNNRAAFTFQWTIGNDPTLGASEYCKFGLKPPDVGATIGKCDACSCTGPGNLCELASDTGTKANVGAATPCVSSRIAHQCMFVELSAPNGGVDFVEQSSWNNMDFDQMSVVSREALIDARQLPKAKGQAYQDIYLIAMARNMPTTISGGPKDGAFYVRDRVLVRAESLAQPYLEEIDRNRDLVAAKIKELGRQPGAMTQAFAAAASSSKEQDPPEFRERIARVARALDIMPQDDFNRVRGLLSVALVRNTNSAAVNEAVFNQVGPVEAAGVVPTIEIYPFYQPLGVGSAYLPMTAFTVFLSHEGTMSGMNWVIDGATKVGQNIYHLRVPVGFARKIQVRAEAIEAAGMLGPQNPRWPCAGGCAACGGANRNCGLVATVGNSVPGILAGVLVIRRRRKRKASPPAAA